MSKKIDSILQLLEDFFLAIIVVIAIFLVFIVFLFVVYFSIYASSKYFPNIQESDIMSEILLLDKPTPKRHIDISSIVGNYIYEGMPKEDAFSFFKKRGYEIKEYRHQELDNGRRSYYAVYEFGEMVLPFLKRRFKIIIKFPVVENRIIEYSGVYLENTWK